MFVLFTKDVHGLHIVLKTKCGNKTALKKRLLKKRGEHGFLLVLSRGRVANSLRIPDLEREFNNEESCAVQTNLQQTNVHVIRSLKLTGCNDVWL